MKKIEVKRNKAKKCEKINIRLCKLNMAKKILVIVMSMVLILSLTACQKEKNSESKDEKLVVAYQMGISYTPLLIMKDQKLIEKHYGKKIDVEWKLMASGAAISEGITAGSVDFGALGSSVAINGIMSNVPYKICTGLAAVSCGIQTSDKNINSLKDITKDKQIAVTQINSQPHILLAMAAKKELGDAHALDKNLVPMANADGYSALISGAVQCHMVLSPYNIMEDEEDNMHTIKVSDDVWTKGNTSIVGIGSENIYKNNPELYKAFCDATEEAMKYIKENPNKTAKLLTESYDASEEEILKWLKDDSTQYNTNLQGIMELSNFMVEEGFMDKGPKNIKELTFDNVKGN